MVVLRHPACLSRRRFMAAMAATSVTTPLFVPARLLAQTPAATPEPVAGPAGFGPQLYVSATDFRFDEAFDIGVAGLQPGSEVTIRSDFTDADGQAWSGEATWLADGFGNVWCSGSAPVGGSFAVADAMALIWAAEAGAPATYAPTLFGAEAATISATQDGAEIGRQTISRTVLPEPDSSIVIDTPDLVARFFPPAAGSTTPAPGILVLGGSDGGISTDSLLTAALLAADGYAALAVGYFGPDGDLPRTLENVPLEYFGDAIAYLQEQQQVDAGRLGVVGRSRGGELALLLGAYYPELTAVASIVGSGYVFPGYDGTTPNPANAQPAWTWRGEPLPFLTFSGAPDEIAAAEIAVERIDGPVLLVSADADAVWSSSILSRVAWDRLQRADHPWPDQFLTYPGAGHGILTPYRPMTFDRSAPLAFGGDPASDQVASVNAWRAVTTMFDWRLKRGG